MNINEVTGKSCRICRYFTILRCSAFEKAICASHTLDYTNAEGNVYGATPI